LSLQLTCFDDDLVVQRNETWCDVGRGMMLPRVMLIHWFSP
jgi:hypothetical protein